MKSVARAFLIAGLGLSVLAGHAHAQESPLTWNAGIGLSMPSTSGYNTGFNARVGVTLPLTGSPVWIRPELGLDHFSVDCTDCGSLTAIGVGADAGYTFVDTGKISPYVLGGLQLTHLGFSASGFSSSVTRLGINLGGGITMPIGSQVGYAEIRYVAAGGGFDMIPLTIGLRF